MTTKLALASSLLLGSLAGCASQVDADHQGTALATLGGSVRNARTVATGDAEVVVLWHNTSGSPDLTGTDSVEVEGSFPAQFTLSIYQPPAPELLNDWNGIKFGVAYIIAASPGTDVSDDDSAGLLGIDANHLLVYLPQDIPAGSEVATLLRGTPRAGFHIYGVHKLSDAEQLERQQCEEGLGTSATMEQIYSTCGGAAWFDDFVPLDTDLDTNLEVELVDDINDVDPPNWT